MGLVEKETLLHVHHLQTFFDTYNGVVWAVDGINLHLKYGETTAIVGESGSGKSATLLSILRLIQTPPGHIEARGIFFEGTDLLKLSEREMKEIRGNKIAMIFQEPMTSLNPVIRVGDQIAEAIIMHRKANRREARDRAIDMLRLVRIPDPEKRLKDYPHQMSGGMRQRIMIAMALSCNPKLLLADEPTTALDGTIQAQILDLVSQLKKELGMAVIWVTHDLGVVAEIAQSAVVMYGGKVMEEGNIFSIFHEPLHPYTEGLLKSIPRIDEEVERLHVIPGIVPDAKSFPKGCRFHPRCFLTTEKCRQTEPALKQVDRDHSVACHLREGPKQSEQRGGLELK